MTRGTGRNIIAEQQAHDKRMKLLVYGGTALAVLAMGIGVFFTIQGKKDSYEKVKDVVTPSVANKDYGITLTPSVLGSKVKDEDVKTTVIIYEDFSCPACRVFEESTNATLVQLAKDGKANIEYRLVGFLDDGAAVGNHSKRAASASLCVAEAGGMGDWKKFHDWLYEEQPVEGLKGQSNLEFFEAAEELGLKVDEDCVRAETYVPWMKNATKAFRDAGVSGTPNVIINGKEVDANAVSIVKAVDAANAAG